jgi:hypothetical protein
MNSKHTAAPHMFAECDGEQIPVDMFIEKYGMGILPAKYERALEHYFDTTDKRVMMRKSLSQRVVPVMCPSGNVELIEKDSGDLVKRVSRELIAVAKLLVD